MKITLQVLFFWAFFLSHLHALPPLQPSVDEIREYTLISGFVYNFGRFVSFPEEPSGKFTVCVASRQEVPLDVFRTTLDGKVLGAAVIEVRPFLPAGDSCYILYLHRSEENNRSIIASLSNRPVLVVGDREALNPGQGEIQLFTEENRLKFTINLKNCMRKNLRPSSKMIKLGQVVGNG